MLCVGGEEAPIDDLDELLDAMQGPSKVRTNTYRILSYRLVYQMLSFNRYFYLALYTNAETLYIGAKTNHYLCFILI